MQYMIQLQYLYGWDDAGWTEETADGEIKPDRFGSIEEAHAALEEFFAEVKAAVSEGNMDSEEGCADYRIVPVNA